MRNIIPIRVKRECLRMKNEGATMKWIYDNHFIHQVENPCTLTSFKRAMIKWSNMVFPDDATLEGGTYEGFIAHNATVQVSKTGEIVQAWIKQKASDFDPEEFIQALREKIEPYEYEPNHDKNADRMLEIPLFDMHWGISTFKDYEQILHDILEVIPEEFAQATIREIHSGHLHHETEADIYGVMVRRLSSGAAVDDWSNRQDFVGTHRRFMIFEWGLNSLRSIHYI